MENTIRFQKHQQEEFKEACQRGEQIEQIVAEALKVQKAEQDRLINRMKSKLGSIETGIISAYQLSERAVGYMISNDITGDSTDELWCYVNSVNAILILLEEILMTPD